MPAPQPQIPLAPDEIRVLCEKMEIEALWLFGSVLRDSFSETSDIDVMVQYKPEAPTHIFHVMKTMDALAALWGRKIDLVLRKQIVYEAVYGGPQEQACCQDILHLAVCIYRDTLALSA
jgi:predicted nucleotidyltransferase